MTLDSLEAGQWVLVHSFRPEFLERLELAGCPGISAPNGIPQFVVGVCLPFVTCRPGNQPDHLTTIDIRDCRLTLCPDEYSWPWVQQYFETWKKLKTYLQSIAGEPSDPALPKVKLNETE